MNLISDTFSTLSRQQSVSLQDLVSLCRASDPFPLYADLEDCGQDYGFPRFFFLYNEENILVHATFLTVISKSEWNLFFFTRPDCRRQGCFGKAAPFIKELCREAAKRRCCPSILTPVSPENQAAAQILLKYGFFLSYSDYLMACSTASHSSSALPDGCSLSEDAVRGEDRACSAAFHLFAAHGGRKSKREVASCIVSINGPSAFLSHVETKKRYRNRGFGTILVSYTAGLLHRRGISTLRLHTDSANLPALRLYQKLEFRTELQIDMWAFSFNPECQNG